LNQDIEFCLYIYLRIKSLQSFYLGSAQLSAKKYKEAIESLNKAVAIAPKSAMAEAYLGWCYFGLKDAAGFKDHAGKARTLGWTDAQLLDRLKRVEAGEAIK
jgi:tetratricopeptide (TPR) repeat protein